MSNSNNNTQTDTPQAVLNEFQTFMSLRDRGVDKDQAFRAADHVRRATNEGGDKGAAAAARSVLIWLGLGVVVLASVIAYTQNANAAAPSAPPANMIHLPILGRDCRRITCSSSVPMPTLTPTASIAPPVPVVTVEVQ